MTTSNDKQNLHSNNCCMVHGCRFYDKNCPVRNGKASALLKCGETEVCPEHTVDNLEDCEYSQYD